MDYLKLIRAFWSRHDAEAFSGNEMLLYWRIVDLFNAAGKKEVWPTDMRLGDGQICLATGLSPNTMDKARKLLMNRQLIRFQASGKGFRGGGNYELINTYNSAKRTSTSSSKRTSEIEELEERTSNFEELQSQVPQKEPQQVPQKVPQNLSNSYIYKESKPQTPNLQTLKRLLLVADRNELSVRQAWHWLLKNKKKQSPPTSGSPPQSSIVTRIRRSIEDHVEGYYWTAKDGAAAKALAGKLQSAITRKSGQCTEEDILNAFLVLLNRTAELPAYYQFTDLPTLNSKFNEILTQLRIPRNDVNRASQNRPQRPSDAEFASAIDELADWKYRRSGNR